MNTQTKTDVIRTREAKTLRGRVHAIRRRSVGVAVSTGLTLVLALAIAVVAVEMLADWRLELAWGIRCALMTAGCAALGWWFATRFCRWPGEDTVALSIERKLPSFEGRLIAAIQLSRSRHPGMSQALVRALLAEAAAIEAQLHFGRVVDTARLRRALLIAGVALVAVTGTLTHGTPLLSVLFRRALLLNDGIPRKTRITVTAGDRNIAVGDNVAIEAVAAGVIPAFGGLQVKTSPGRVQEFSLDADPAAPTRFRRTLESVQESFAYSIRLNDAETPLFRVTAWPRPAVTNIECEQVFPAYTRLGTVRRSLGNLTLLAGSRLNLKIAASARLSSATVRLSGTAGEAPVRIDRGDPRSFSASIFIPAKGLAGFSIQLTDEHGVGSRDSAVHRLDIVPDRPPTVRITVPDRAEESVTPQGALLVGYEADDDFGIARVTLHYALKPSEARAAATGASEQKVDLEVPAANTKAISRQFEWKLGALSFRPKAGDAIEYWIDATDCNDVTGPGVGSTVHYQVKIVTPEEKRAEMAERLMNSFEGLNDIAADQEKLNKDMGKIVHEKNVK